ncbi:putative orf26 [Vibrio phage 424E50-1]|nr:putative orf26 [Vibrio phage 424E50-1]
MTIKTLIVSAFPACGKSFYHNEGEKYDNYFTTLDSDSSKFSWILDDEGNSTGVRNPNFPVNYMQHIQDNLGKVSIIFVSSHDEVRSALEEESLPYVTVMPSPNLKGEWLERCKLRGSPEGFINLIDNMWETWTSFESQRKWSPVERLFLNSGEYLADYIFQLDTFRDWHGTQDNGSLK